MLFRLVPHWKDVWNVAHPRSMMADIDVVIPFSRPKTCYWSVGASGDDESEWSSKDVDVLSQQFNEMYLPSLSSLPSSS